MTIPRKARPTPKVSTVTMKAAESQSWKGSIISDVTTTKSPAAATTNSNYDLFVWNDGGTYRCTRGPAWSSDTARGTGAGTTELQLLNGILTNKNAITNGPAANKGTYVGTVRTNGSSQVDFQLAGMGTGPQLPEPPFWIFSARRLTASFWPA